MADDRQREDATKAFEDGLRELSKLPAEQRIYVYEAIFGKDGEGRPPLIHQDIAAGNVFLEPLRNFDREKLQISDEGAVVYRQPRVFLSHSHQDKPLAREIFQQLSAEGVYVWFDEAELKFGDSLISKLEGAIDNVDILLALISKHSIESAWVKREIEIAMNQEIDNRQVTVIPLLGDDVRLPGFLVGKLYADVRTPALRQENLPKLVADIKAHLEQR